MVQSWFYWAAASAVFAAMTAIFAKLGLQGVDSDFATFIRTLVIVAALMLFLTYANKWQPLGSLTGRNWLFLVLSGLATGASWLAYFKALQLGKASQVAPWTSSVWCWWHCSRCGFWARSPAARNGWASAWWPQGCWCWH